MVEIYKKARNKKKNAPMETTDDSLVRANFVNLTRVWV